MKKYYIESKRRGISYVQQKEVVIGLVIYRVRTAVKNTLWKERQREGLEVKGGRGRRHKQLLEYRKGKIACWKLIAEALDRTP